MNSISTVLCQRVLRSLCSMGRQKSVAIRLIAGLLVMGLALASQWPTGVSAAPPTPEQKKQLSAIKASIGKIAPLIKGKKADEAEAAITAAEDELSKLVSEAKWADTDPPVAILRKLLHTQKVNLAKLTGKPIPGTVSFAEDVAPVIAEKCLTCHGATNPRANLRLDTFAGWKKGGAGGPLLVVGQPLQSLLVQRIASQNPQARMPRGGEALTVEQIQKIGTWIAEGSVFDGADESNELTNLNRKPAAPVTIAKPTGNERVSFTKDVAPTLVNVCGGCHNDNNRGGGLSLVTFEKLLQGGDGGLAIVPGKLEESRLWRLVNADEEPVMPRGQARITRKWHSDLRIWITEGAKFDGTDAKRPLRELIPTDAEVKEMELAKLTPEGWVAMRDKTSQEQWALTFPSSEPMTVSSDEFLLMGDVSEARLQLVNTWATEHVAQLRKLFGVQDAPLWKGKLALFVLKERFGYEEFNSTVHRREVPREVLGHSEVAPTHETALVAVQDIGDEASDSSPGLQLSVIEHLTGAFLKRGGDKLPDWIIRGSGLAMTAGKFDGSDEYLSNLRTEASGIVRSAQLARPEELFSNGAFAPGEVGAVSFALVEFLIKTGGTPKFGQLIQRLQSGEAVNAALQSVYQGDARSLAVAFASSLGPAGTKRPGRSR